MIASAPPLDAFLQSDEMLHVAADGHMLLHSTGRCPPGQVLLPGSFNPIHRGHWELARIAARLLGQPVAFELSVRNVDKPPLERDEIRRRLTQFDGQASLWLTHAPLFVQKGERFPGATFVIGADTAVRLVSPRYYAGGEPGMLAALGRMRALGCHFLIACRADEQRKCWRLADVPIPSSFADVFAEIAPEEFRWDISSTQLRQSP